MDLATMTSTNKELISVRQRTPQITIGWKIQWQLSRQQRVRCLQMEILLEVVWRTYLPMDIPTYIGGIWPGVAVSELLQRWKEPKTHARRTERNLHRRRNEGSYASFQKDQQRWWIEKGNSKNGRIWSNALHLCYKLGPSEPSLNRFGTIENWHGPEACLRY